MKTAILIAAIGNSRGESCAAAVGAVEDTIAKHFPDYELRRVFRDRSIHSKTDPVQEALDRAAAEGVGILIVQPTYLLHGFEYKSLAEQLKRHKHKFRRLVLGEPLLADDADMKAVREAIIKQTADLADTATAVCFVGHGGEEGSENVYKKMQQMLTEAGNRDYYIGTIKGELSLAYVRKALRAGGSYRTVVLRPFMAAAGAHVQRDIAGSQDGSWRRTLEQEGYEVICEPEGLGQIPAVQEIYAAHVRAAEELANSSGRNLSVF